MKQGRKEVAYCYGCGDAGHCEIISIVRRAAVNIQVPPKFCPYTGEQVDFDDQTRFTLEN